MIPLANPELTHPTSSADMPDHPEAGFIVRLDELAAIQAEEEARLRREAAKDPAKARTLAVDLAALSVEAKAARKHIGEAYRPLVGPLEWAALMEDEEALISALEAEDGPPDGKAP